MTDVAAWPRTAPASDVAEPAVVVRDVFCVHRTSQGDAAALQGLTLTVGAGERVCLLGPSGAGKTTLLRVIAGLQRPSAGTVRVFGTDIGRLSGRAAARARHATIGVLHQQAETALSPELPVATAVALPLALRGVDRARRRSRAHELLAAAGLGDRLDALPAALSGGERQRVAVCAALAHRPRLLLADEPTAELDATAADSLTRLIEDLAAGEGTTVIVVSHDPELAARSARTVRIRDGRVVADGEALVVAPGGWVRLGDDRIRSAGIGDRVRAQPIGEGLLLTPVGQRDADAPSRPRATTAAPAATRSTPVGVAVRSVTRVRGGRSVLHDLSLTVTPGAMTAVVGRSGAGKTTLLELLAGLARPDAGAILLDDHPLGDSAEQRAATRRRLIGYLPQEPAPVGFLSGVENIALALSARAVAREDRDAIARAALAQVGLTERADQRVSRLSAGEGQRVALARALACARGLLIVDEPTSRLDEETAARVAGVLAHTARSAGQTVVCATHDPQVIALADETITLAG
jgi:ABC-type lipoprotein export system ATPase subunit